MGKVTEPPPKAEVFCETEYEHLEFFPSEFQTVKKSAKPGLTPSGFDEEMGLWEEVNIRKKEKNQPIPQFLIHQKV